VVQVLLEFEADMLTKVYPADSISYFNIMICWFYIEVTRLPFSALSRSY